MPDFSRAQVSSNTGDLSAYTAFLRKLTVGQVVALPLEGGETSRKVMRELNTAVAQLGMRITRLSADKETVRFRVVSPEKRSVKITAEQKQARVEKARATRAARRQAHRLDLPELVADPTGHQGDQPINAALAAPDLGLEEAIPAEQQPPLTTEQADRARAELPETAEVQPSPDQQVQEAASEEVSPSPTRRSRRARSSP